jgi:hypothetical protein
MRQTIIIPWVVLKLPKKDKDLDLHAQGICTALTNNTYCPNPTPSLTDLLAVSSAYTKAVAAANGTKDPVLITTRKDARTALKTALGHLRDCIQGVVEKNIALADTIAASVNMSIRKIPIRSKAQLAADEGAVSGEVLLVAKAVAEASCYYWQFSANQTSWTSAPETTKATTTISGLTPGQTYYFRFRVLTSKGVTDWSAAVPYLVSK